MRIGDRFGGIVVDNGGTRLELGQGLIIEVTRYIERTEAWARRVILDEAVEPIGYWVNVLQPEMKLSSRIDGTALVLEARLHNRAGRWILYWAGFDVEVIISGA